MCRTTAGQKVFVISEDAELLAGVDAMKDSVLPLMLANEIVSG